MTFSTASLEFLVYGSMLLVAIGLLILIGLLIKDNRNGTLW